MDNVNTNPNDSSLLPVVMPPCAANCFMKAKLSDLMAAQEKERKDYEFQIALRDKTIEYLTGEAKANGEMAEHLQELIHSFKRSTFSGTTMKLTDAQLRSYLEEVRKDLGNAAPAPDGKDDPTPEGKGDPAPEEKGDPAPEGKGDPTPEGKGDPASEEKGDPESESGVPAGNHADQGEQTDADHSAGPDGNTQNGGRHSNGNGTGTTKRGRPQGSTGSFVDRIPAENREDGGIVGLPEEERKCPHCGSLMEHMGFKEQKRLTLVPAQFVLKTTRYETYCCKHCKKEGTSVIKQTPMPSHFLPHSHVEPEVVAHFAAQKLNLGVPMNTQSQDFASRGIPITRQDICNYMTRAAEQYAIPVAMGIERHLMTENDVLATDETFDMEVKGGTNESGENVKKRTTVWVFKAEKGKSNYPGTVYQYGQSRTKERLENSIYDFSHTPVHTVSLHDLDALDNQQRDALETTLRICEPNINNRQKTSGTAAGDGDPEETFEFDRVFEDAMSDMAQKDQWFRGALDVLAKKKYVQSDAYGGYHFLRNTINSGCHAHARAKEFRGFVSCRKLEHRKVLFELLCHRQDLFTLEREYKDNGLDWEERFRERLKRSFPVLQEITKVCNAHYLEAKAAGGLYWEAIRYNINQMPYLYAFLLDGRLEMTNSMSERAVKCYARLRRNSLFHMSDLGGKSDCGYLTILKTAVDWDLVPEKYLTFVLREASRIRPTDPELLKAGDWVEPLLPHNAPDWCKINYQP